MTVGLREGGAQGARRTRTTRGSRRARSGGGGFRDLLSSLAGPRHALHAPDYWLITILLTLAMFGTVMVFSASFTIGITEDSGNAYYYLIRQLLWLAVGLVGLLITYSIDYRFWRRLSLPGMVVVLGLLAVVVLVPGLGAGAETWGADRWIPLGPLSFQPSEVAKPILIIYLANWLGQKGDKIRRFDYGLVPFAVFLGGMIGLVMLQPDLGTSTLLAAIGISMFLVAGADLMQLGLLMGAGTVAFLVMALGASYRRARILIFLDPERDMQNLGWQLTQARLALGSGGLFGLGLGASRQKFSWLPAAQNDAIFAVIGEELGLVGCAFVLALFLALAWRGYRIAKRAPDTFGTLVAVGIVTWMIFQAAINIGGITLTIPFTGIPLPFISYGGTALAVSLTSMGILLNISRQTVQQDVVPAPAAEERPSARARPRTFRPRAAGSRHPNRLTDPELERRPNLSAPRATGMGAVRSLDGREQSRAGSFGRGRARRSSRMPRGPSSNHWR